MMWRRVTITGGGNYEVSDVGTVRRDKRILKGTINKQGYVRVELTLTSGRRSPQYVHRLVALAFIPNDITARTEVNHIDGDRQNNCKANLEWLDHTENMNYIGNDWYTKYDYCPF